MGGKVEAPLVALDDFVCILFFCASVKAGEKIASESNAAARRLILNCKISFTA
jgi:hypothetical protein